jgi:hypothetical protein
VLDQERQVEPDERALEVEFAQGVIEHPAGDLREPEVDPGEGGEHDRAVEHVVEVRDDELGVTELEVDRRSVQQHPGQPAEQERH